jgi:hypothetical protein
MDKDDVTFRAFERMCASFEITIKRLWIAIILLTVLLVGTNCAWLWYESQFEDVVSETTTTESFEADATDGGVAIANGDGEVTNNG